MSFTIRAASAEDADAIAGVHIDGWRWGYRGQLPDEFLDGLDPVTRAARWRAILAGELGPVSTFVAERERRVVGFASCGPARDDDSSGAGEVYAIYVEESAAGTGVGAALLHQVVMELRDRFAFDSAFLWVLESNARARRFYEREGWLADGVAKTDVLGGVTVRELRYRARTIGRSP